MPDVFISYSRKDKEFVSRLYEALAEHKAETWVDWEGIPPTAEWLQEIFAAIEGSDAFVFVISPDGVMSEVCQLEVAHALKHNKRLIPVVCQEVNAQEVPAPLADRNWIFFREDDDFKTAFGTLMEAVKTDLDWVRAHTRLLVKALEWDRQQRDKSYLLRGRDLREAEAWLTQSDQKEPKPTEIQGAYVASSRKAQTRRLSLMLGAVTAGLITAMVLAAVAFQQYLVARHNRNLEIARKLAAQADAFRLKHPHLPAHPTLLAMESLHHTVLPEGLQAFSQALGRMPMKVAQIKHDVGEELTCLALSPDGKLLVTVGSKTSPEGTIILWKASTGKEIAKIPEKGKIDKMTFSPDGKWLAIERLKMVCLISLASMKEEWQIPQAGFLIFSPDSKWLATREGKGVKVWEVVTRQEAARFPDIEVLIFSPEGNWITLQEDKPGKVYDAATKREIRQTPDGYSLTGLSMNGRFLVLKQQKTGGAWNRPTKSLKIWETGSGSSWKNLEDLGKPQDVFLVSSDGNSLAGIFDKGILRLWVEDQTLSEKIGDEVKGLIFSSDSQWMVVEARGSEWIKNLTDYYDIVCVWDLDKKGERVRLHLDEKGLLAFGPKNTRFAVSESNEVQVWDFSPAGEVARIIHGMKISKLAFSPDGKWLAASERFKQTKIWEPVTGREIARIDQQFMGEIFFGGPQGKWLFTSKTFYKEHDWTIWDFDPLRKVAHYHTDGPLAQIKFSPGQELVALIRGDGEAFWGRVGTPQEDLTHLPIEHPVKTVEFRSNSRWLFISDKYYGTQIWDLEKNEEVRDQGKVFTNIPRDNLPAPADKELEILKNRDGVNASALSPDGRTLATATSDGTIHCWDTTSGQEISQYEVSANALCFSPDGKWLAAAGKTAIHLLLWRREDLEKEACKRLTQNLSRSEWRQYLPDEPYRPTCSNLPVPKD